MCAHMAFTIWRKHTAAKSKILFINPNFLEFAGIFDFEIGAKMEKNLNFEFLNKNCVFAAVCAASCKLKTRSLFLYFKVVFTLCNLATIFFSTRYVMSPENYFEFSRQKLTLN